MDLRSLGTSQLDAMREVANIGAGHAATALSQMTNHVIMIDVPEVSILRLEEVDRILGEPDEVVAAVMMKVLGDMTGRTLQVFPGPSAVKLTAMLLGGPEPTFPEGFGEAHQSTLKEIGNIIVGAYLNALSDFMGLLLIMSVPAIAIDMAGAVMTTSYLNFGETRDFVFCVNTIMTMDGAEIRAHFLLIPDDTSLGVMLREMKLA
ncbi:MAG TPA: chemotaxis protein CheC [Longimicrobiales bacterium]|nr:chemotaxis protein CheC [Longimicrobiales bacterium]